MNQKTTALVTGANKGIGFAIAQGLGRRGYTVAVGARDQARRETAVDKLRADGVDAFGVALDVTSDQEAAAAAETIERTAGRLDVLVNNAGISGPVGEAQDPLELDIDVVRTVWDTNVFGIVRVTNAMLPLLRRSESPRIVNMSSSMGSLSRPSGPVLAGYTMSKTMVNSLTTQYARRLADTNILVNSACPGFVDTDFTRGMNAPRTPEEGAATAIRLATLPDDGPRGGFFDDDGALPW